MIDFRYHIVSLVSVFLALAVGIVLGAGPLRDDLGSQLSGQVEQLRSETEDLRGRLDGAEVRADDADAWIEAAGPALVEDTLTGQQVALVVTDESLAQTSQQVTDLVRAAGGDVGLTVRIRPAMWEPEGMEARTVALDAIRAADPTLLSDRSGDDDPSDADRLVAAVGRVLARDADDGGAEARAAVFDALSEQNLATVSGEVDVGASSVLALTSDPAAVDEASDTAAAAERTDRRQSAFGALFAAVGEDGTPAVAAGSVADATRDEGLVFHVRGTADLEDVSTVGGLEHPDGRITAVLALAEQVRGGSGSYGPSDGAAARLPDLEFLDAPSPGGPAGGDGATGAVPTAPTTDPTEDGS